MMIKHIDLDISRMMNIARGESEPLNGMEK